MECYNLIQNPEEVKRFLNILPEQSMNECLTIALFVRKKYAKGNKSMEHLSLSNDDGCWDRTIVSASKRDRDNKLQSKVYRAILKYNTPIGTWVDRNGVDLPEDLLSLYISINPRCAVKGTRELISSINRDCFLPTTSEEPFVGNLVSRAKTMLQKNVSRKLIADIDIDIKDENVLKVFRDLVQGWDSEVCSIETRGGYHILTDINKMSEANKKWHPIISKLADEYKDEEGKSLVEFKTDTLCPIVGSKQAGFTVKII